MEEYFAKEKPVEEPEHRRPSSLTLLCVLTFIGSGLSAFSFMFMSVFHYMIPAAIDQISKSGMEVPGYELLKSVPRTFYILNLILYTGSFYGALEMWRLKKIGFHVYTISQLLIIVVSMIYLGVSITSGGTFLSLAFIILYAMNLKSMKS